MSLRVLSCLAVPIILLINAGQGADAARAGHATFAKCGSAKRVNCVVDGDTFWLRGTKVRVADIDTPETHRPSCPAEALLGERATIRFAELLNEGSFALEPTGSRDEDRYGRKLRIVTRDGQSLGMQLVAEGLARPWVKGAPTGRDVWCTAG